MRVVVKTIKHIDLATSGALVNFQTRLIILLIVFENYTGCGMYYI